MAGIYIHVPFCKSRCVYCDFYSTTGHLQWAEAYVSALKREMMARRDEIPSPTIDTLYVGGGTPSSLPASLLVSLLKSVTEFFPLSPDAEVTVEANPDDVTDQWLSALADTPVNRISMGVQTFDDALLVRLGRRHDSSQAMRAIERCHRNGIDNVSIDLIYALPGQTLPMWEHDVEQALALDIRHLSAYALSYESGTPLARMLAEGRISEVDEEVALSMYAHLMEQAKARGWHHYEISNFCRPGFHSRHNSSYWQGLPYLGFGPAAHSYDGLRQRRWNTTNLQAYISDNEVPHESEQLSDDELYDEFIMTRLRTSQGADLSKLTPERREYCMRMARAHMESGKLTLKDGKLCLSEAGIFVSNDIISDLMH